MEPDQLVILATVLLTGSELIALSPLRANSWVQLFLSALRGISSTKTPRR